MFVDPKERRKRKRNNYKQINNVIIYFKLIQMCDVNIVLIIIIKFVMSNYIQFKSFLIIPRPPLLILNMSLI